MTCSFRRYSGGSSAARPNSPAPWTDLIGQNYAKNAVESAVWAMTSAKLDTPLASLWGATRQAVPAGESFPICDSTDVLLAKVDARLREGFGRVKLKIAPGWDVNAVAAVHRVLPGIPVSVDANCGYLPGSGPWQALDDYGLVMIEQPFAADALIELAELQQTIQDTACAWTRALLATTPSGPP